MGDPAASIDEQFWGVFSRAMGCEITPGRYEVADVAQWDSLRHVELVFTLEEQFGIRVPPDAIAALFSDTDTVRGFVRQALAAPAR